MKFVIQLYRYCNYLSLDVASGAMICAAFFARIMQVQLRPSGLASLGLTVWIIYTVDHLLDARKLNHQASSPRHRFHQTNFRWLLIFLALAIVLDFLLIFFVRRPILNWGMSLSALVLFYLVMHRKLTVFKELLVSVLYAAGILLPALSLTMMTLSTAEFILIFIFAITAFINLVLFSWYDWQEDLMDNHSSLVTYLGRTRVRSILIALFLIQACLLAVMILNSWYQMEVLILVAMNLTLLALLLLPRRFSSDNLYRIIGDIVFIFPIFYLL